MNGQKNRINLKRAEELKTLHSDEYILSLYEKYKHNPSIKWKDSIKKIVGLSLEEESGRDV